MTTQQDVHIPEWTLSDRLRKAREDAGLSQQQLADRLAVSRNTVGNAETGARRPLPITIKAWADATGVPLPWLLTGEAPRGYTPGGLTLLPRLDSNQKPPGLRYAASSGTPYRPAVKVAA